MPRKLNWSTLLIIIGDSTGWESGGVEKRACLVSLTDGFVSLSAQCIDLIEQHLACWLWYGRWGWRWGFTWWAAVDVYVDWSEDFGQGGLWWLRLQLAFRTLCRRTHYLLKAPLSSAIIPGNIKRITSLRQSKNQLLYILIIWLIFGAILQMITRERLKQIGWELFIILWNDPIVLTGTNYFCMKTYSALHTLDITIKYTPQATKWKDFEVSAHVPTSWISYAKRSLAYIYPIFEDW